MKSLQGLRVIQDVNRFSRSSSVFETERFEKKSLAKARQRAVSLSPNTLALNATSQTHDCSSSNLRPLSSRKKNNFSWDSISFLFVVSYNVFVSHMYY